MPFARPALLATGLFAAVLLALALTACSPLPDTGADPATAGPAPPLVQLEGLLSEPAPQATAESAEALAERGAALKAEAQSLK